MKYFGDYTVDATVNVMFTTSDSNGGAVAPSTAFETADVLVYKGVSGTQRTSTSGQVLVSPFDATTGLHSLSIDTSDNTDAGFYVAGNDYTVVLVPDETVDGQTVVSVLGQFSIENRFDNDTLKPTVAGRTLDVTATGAAGIDWANVENPTTAVDLSQTDIQLCDTVALITGFGASSPDRLVDHFRSIMSKGAVTPASVGTYSPATDSLEFQAEQQALGLGAGFTTSTDSLKGIRDAIDTLVAPSVVSSSALSGSGFLSDCVSLIRKAVDEPSVTPKYTDGDIIELLQVAIDQVITDVHVNTDHPIMVRHSITLVDGVQDYILPPQVGELIRVAKIFTATGLAEYEIWPGSYHDPGNHGWKIEGNILRILRDWNSTDVLELLYIPNSEPLLHKGTAEAVAATTITLMAVPTDGTLGTRPNEYVGMVVRVLSSTENVKEERVITAYDVSTRIATINKAWDTTPTGVLVYEVIPTFGRVFKHVVCLRAAIDLLSQEGNSSRMSTLERNYFLKMSALRRQINKKEGRFPGHFDGNTWDNENRTGFWGP